MKNPCPNYNPITGNFYIRFRGVNFAVFSSAAIYADNSDVGHTDLSMSGAVAGNGTGGQNWDLFLPVAGNRVGELGLAYDQGTVGLYVVIEMASAPPMRGTTKAFRGHQPLRLARATAKRD